MKAIYEILGKSQEDFQDNKLFKESVRRWDIEAANQNLKDVLRVGNTHGVTLGLQYGTLLGYVRDGKLIEHDYDIDTFSLQSEYLKIAEMIRELETIGFKLIRSHKDGVFNTVIRDGVTLDFYSYRDHGDGTYNNYSDWMTSEYLVFDKKEFLGEPVNIFQNPEIILAQWYGDEWRVPQKGKSAIPFDRRNP